MSDTETESKQKPEDLGDEEKGKVPGELKNENLVRSSEITNALENTDIGTSGHLGRS